MFAAEWRGVETDWCSVCGGVWLDRGEYEILSGGVPPVIQARPSSATAARDRRLCPICDRSLDAVIWEAISLEVDRCPEGHGFYFDRGELSVALAQGIAARDPLWAGHFQKFSHLKEDPSK